MLFGPEARKVAQSADTRDDAAFADKVLNVARTADKTPGIDATNYRAEQAMRPAAVNRKVWGGNRTAAGAHAQSVLMTILATCRQQARDSLRFLADILTGDRPRLALLPAGP